VNTNLEAHPAIEKTSQPYFPDALVPTDPNRTEPMKHILLSILALCLMASHSQAHFLFIVPEPGNREAYVILSEDLEPDSDVPAAMLSGAKVFLLSLDGSVRSLELLPTDSAMRVNIDLDGTQLLYGSFDVGVHKEGDKPGNRVVYHTKTILGDPFSAPLLGTEKSPVELTPIQLSGGMGFRFTSNGKPVAGAEVMVFLPDGARVKAATNEVGVTRAFTQKGRYGAWTKTVIGGAGEYEGKSYAESRGYAMLVVQSAEPANAVQYSPLPQAVSSFGAVESEGYLYVYGGHTARTHDYDTEAVSGRFSRLDLTRGGFWERLPGGPALQGMNLAAHTSGVYRVGGMQPRNPRGTKADNYSVADCSRFNPITREWEWLTPMPEGRSSHDLAVFGNTLYVIGGWNMDGKEGGTEFVDTMLTLDLTDSRATWKSIPQPFSRRALIVTLHDGKLYAMGGIDEEDEVSRDVDIFDLQTRRWSKGPELIGNSGYAGFSSAACTLDGRVYCSVAGGDLIRLTEDSQGWEFVGKNKPRIVHRMIPWKSQILVAGGAHKGGNSDSLETIIPRALGTPGVAPAPGTSTPIHGRRSSAEAEPSKASTEVSSAVSATPSASLVKATGLAPVADATMPLNPAAAQVFCPVMTNVEIDEDASVVTYKGQDVLLCCSKCVKKWKKDPEAYLLPEILPQLTNLDLPERVLEQVYCPVFPTRVVSDKDPFVMYKGAKVYLFNKTAVRRWNDNPEKYADSKLLPQLARVGDEGS
jgi:uncharacterized GH25 family protein/YHS domain-containing protein